jgi:curved DNA-binding protein
MQDYYEFLQISPNADSDTIHRVYRFLATRLHPDNPQSGDAEMFHRLKTAYDVLSNPVRRAEYDATRQREPLEIAPWSRSIDFMDRLEGELNRRLAVMAVLYYRRRTNPSMPEVALAEIESRMGFPRDYLDFTTWYLVKKGYAAKADNSAFTLTAEGVDFVETQRAHLPVLNKMLTSGAESAVADAAAPAKPTASEAEISTPVAGRSLAWCTDLWNGRAFSFDPAVISAEMSVVTLDRRTQALDRRTGSRGRRASD